MAKKRKGGGSKLSRTEVVTVRLDPKLRFSAELAAREQNRTLSSFIEWSVQNSLKQVVATYKKDGTPKNYIPDVVEEVWSSDEVTRFLYLAMSYPSLLAYDEIELWDLINKHKVFWGADYEYDHVQDFPYATARYPNTELIEEFWPMLKRVVNGEISEDELKSKLPSKIDLIRNALKKMIEENESKEEMVQAIPEMDEKLKNIFFDALEHKATQAQQILEAMEKGGDELEQALEIIKLAKKESESH
jgi:hypothetical protein